MTLLPFPAPTPEQIALLQQTLQQQAQLQAIYGQRYGSLQNGPRQTNPSLHNNPNQQSSAADFRARWEAARKARYCAPREGIRAGEIIGWRWWNIAIGYFRLQSVSSPTLWEPGTPMGLTGDKEICSLENGYGIHAFRDRATAKNNLRGCVLGTVEMWGEIVEHEKGYRSEWAKIKSLDYVAPTTFLGALLDIPQTKALEQLRKIYHV